MAKIPSGLASDPLRAEHLRGPFYGLVPLVDVELGGPSFGATRAHLLRRYKALQEELLLPTVVVFELLAPEAHGNRLDVLLGVGYVECQLWRYQFYERKGTSARRWNEMERV